MTTKTQQHCRMQWKLTAVAVAAAFATPAMAVEFETAGGWTGSVNTTLAAASTWRAEDPNPEVQIDRMQTHNYKSGDQFSEIYKLNTELLMNKGNTGFVARAKAWYDRALNSNDVPFGNEGNRFNNTTAALAAGTVGGKARSGRPAPLSDDGLPLLARYDGVALLDLYGYTSFDIGESELQLRIGRQAINWGEGIFF